MDMELNIVAGRPNPFNVLCSDNSNAGSVLNRKSGRVSNRCTIKHFHNLLCHVSPKFGIDKVTSPLDRCGEACVIHRLQQVMQSVNVECPQYVFLMRRHKNYSRHVLNWQCAQHLESVQTRHLDIEKHNVRRPLQNCLHCGLPISAFSNDLNVLESAQHECDAMTRQWLIVDDQNPHSDTSWRFRALRNGNSSMTSQPPSSGHPSENTKSVP